MNTVVTSREEILEASRELIRREGLPALSIRSVASACGVSVGSIYNYFDSKADLVGAAVESVWHEIFHRQKDAAPFSDTLACIAWMYGRMEEGAGRYPGFFTLHAVRFMEDDRPGGRRRMELAFRHIRDGLCLVMRRDARIRPDAFTDRLTAEGLADAIISLMVAALLREDYDPSTVAEIVRRVLY